MSFLDCPLRSSLRRLVTMGPELPSMGAQLWPGHETRFTQADCRLLQAGHLSRCPPLFRGTPGWTAVGSDSEGSVSLGRCSQHIAGPASPFLTQSAHCCSPCCFHKGEVGATPGPVPPDPAGERRMDVQISPCSQQKETSACPLDRLKVTCSAFTQRAEKAFQVMFHVLGWKRPSRFQGPWAWKWA